MVGFRRLRLQGEEVVTIWEIVAVAAAAGGRKEVGLGRVWLPCLLWAALSGDGAGRGGREPGTCGQVLPARLGVSEYLTVQSEKSL